MLVLLWFLMPYEKAQKANSWLWKAEATLIVLEAWCLCTTGLIDLAAAAVDKNPPTSAESIPPGKLLSSCLCRLPRSSYTRGCVLV